MKTKRILSLLMAGALLTGALTGCGGKKDDSAQSGDNSGVITINYPTSSAARIRPLRICDELIKEFNEKYAASTRSRRKTFRATRTTSTRSRYSLARRSPAGYLRRRLQSA